MRHQSVIFLGILLGCLAAVQGQNHTKTRLLSPYTKVTPGTNLEVILELAMDPGWHTYWVNSGDSGMPTTLEWDLPEGFTAGEMVWPTPEKTLELDIYTYAYKGTVRLLIPLQVADTVSEKSYVLKATARWLECKESCIMGSANLTLPFEVAGQTEPSEHHSTWTQARNAIPPVDPSPVYTATWSPGEDEDTRQITLRWTGQDLPANFDFYPYASDNYELGSATKILPSGTDHRSIEKQLTRYSDDWPAQLAGLVVYSGAESTREAKQVRFVFEQTQMAAGGETVTPVPAAPPTSVSAPTPPTSTPTSDLPLAAGSAPISLLKALLYAFIGGLILNVMPCVLPVISLKILSFVNQSQESPQRLRFLGLMYSLGVVISFLLLAFLVLGVQRAGGIASWGMAFQYPFFRVGMTVLMLLVALNLFGVFEITLGGGVLDKASSLTHREGPGGAFFNGLLATLLATPCTAPFLTPAIGFALVSQSSSLIILIFATVGLGLAAPFFLLCWNPKWLAWMPKPGAWMLRFKFAMGFPMLAAAVWLFSLAANSYGKSGVLWLGMFLVVLSFATWIFGEWGQKSLQNKSWGIATSLALILLGYFLILEKQLQWRTSAGVNSPSMASIHNAQDLGPAVLNGKINWKNWSHQAIALAQSAGRPVLVDFTADWCVTCQVNKKTSLEIEATRQKLTQMNAVALLGDFTDQNPAIAEELKRHQRPAVPLVLIYSPNPDVAPIVLPEVLTPSIVLEALERASKS